MDASSLLLEACESGELEAVRVLVEEQDADINATGSYYSGLSKSRKTGACPLFIAAGNCNLPITKYLVSKGANVNFPNRWSDGLSYPLHAAISLNPKLEFEKRKPVIEFLIANRADPSTLTAKGAPMWTLCPKEEPALTILLVNLGMSLTQRRKVTGGTILHHWASSNGSFDQDTVPVIELLLAKGIDFKALDKFGLTPLNVAAIGYPYDGSEVHHCIRPNEPALRYLLALEDTSLLEKINALELAGAVLLLLNGDDRNSISQAFQYWNEALNLREGSIPKVSLNTNSNVHWRAVEWTTRIELEKLQHYSPVNMKMQAILVARRILSHISSKALERYLWNSIVSFYFLRQFPRNRHIEQLEMFWIMLEGARVTDLLDNKLWTMVVKINDCIVWYLKKLKEEQNPILTSDVLKLSLELICDTDRSHLDAGAIRNPFNTRFFRGIPLIQPMHTIYNFVNILSESPEMVTREIKSCLYRFIKRDGRDHFGDNLLLVASDRHPNDSTFSTIRLLLEVGADPTVKNRDGSSPLHLVAYWMGETENDSPTADLLLQYGAHLDQVNKLQETPLNVWKKKQEGRILPPPPWMNTVPRLACLSARSLRRCKIPYDQMPKSFCDFISIH